MPVLIVIYFFLIGMAALLAQMELPVIFPVLDLTGVGSALIPLVVIYASLELGDERAPALAALLGLMLDLASSSHHMGTSVLLLGSLSILIITQAQKAEMGHWMMRLTYVLVGTFAYMILNYLFILIENGRWYWPLDVWTKITLASLFNLILSPFLFLLAGLPPRLCGWKSAQELRKRRYARR
jgi:cell shape-determining protein MreD